MKKSKFWFDNEKKVLKKLGYTPCPLSGAGEMYKEDGYNDYSLCQLKSTEKDSYSLKLLDVQKLEYNSMVSKKIPVFIIEFLNESTWICIRPEDIDNYIKGYSGQEVNITSLSEVVPLEKKKPLKSKPEPPEETIKDDLDKMFEERSKRKEKEAIRKEYKDKWIKK